MKFMRNKNKIEYKKNKGKGIYLGRLIHEKYRDT